MRLCGISSHFWLLSPCTGQVTHALLTRPPLSQRKTSTEISVPQCFVRLACVKHAASVHPEPGSNSLNNCLTQDNLWLSFIPHYCFGSFKPFLNVKNFQVLCVLLFSYQGSLCRPSSKQLGYFTSPLGVCQELFSTFFEVFYQLLVLFVTPSRQLNYNTTSIPGCQLLFLFFSNFLKYYILLLIYRNQEEFITPALETKITYGSVLHCRHISKKTLLPSISYYA